MIVDPLFAEWIGGPARGGRRRLSRPARAGRASTYNRPVEHFDVLVVGAGPAGSATAIHLARGGASVLLADRARFPRDKPCGGGLTGRALKQAPCDVTPVVERVVDTFELRLHYKRELPARSRPSR